MNKILKLIQLILLIVVASKTVSQPSPDCPKSCGNLNIPYPFGTRDGCYMNDTFLVTCNHDSSMSIPLLGTNNILVLNISLEAGEVIVSSPVIRDCHGTESKNSNDQNGLNLTHFSISPSRNKFTAVGCDTVGVFIGYDSSRKHVTTRGCVSMCDTLGEIRNGSCDGIGCCQIGVPDGVYGFAMQSWSISNNSTIRDFNPCNYAFTLAEGYYNFETANLKSLENPRLPLVLDWAVGNQTCEEAQQNPKKLCVQG
ncbi:hypothetical protein V8G54_030583 [Vigna mungo]|uniref:Wall-associated receptor kinase galacturonan-binding domain-containing protein n=1 Tax=Vigna mungo TaxID=3915 RepID=A0AAQ3MVX1_VIGMU